MEPATTEGITGLPYSADTPERTGHLWVDAAQWIDFQNGKKRLRSWENGGLIPGPLFSAANTKKLVLDFKILKTFICRQISRKGRSCRSSSTLELTLPEPELECQNTNSQEGTQVASLLQVHETCAAPNYLLVNLYGSATESVFTHQITIWCSVSTWQRRIKVAQTLQRSSETVEDFKMSLIHVWFFLHQSLKKKRWESRSNKFLLTVHSNIQTTQLPLDLLVFYISHKKSVPSWLLNGKALHIAFIKDTLSRGAWNGGLCYGLNYVNVLSMYCHHSINELEENPVNSMVQSQVMTSRS